MRCDAIVTKIAFNLAIQILDSACMVMFGYYRSKGAHSRVKNFIRPYRSKCRTHITVTLVTFSRNNSLIVFSSENGGFSAILDSQMHWRRNVNQNVFVINRNKNSTSQ